MGSAMFRDGWTYRLARRGGPAGWTLRVCLLLAVCNAPLPLAHSHAALIRGGAAPELLAHLKHYHPSASWCQCLLLGWHFHLIPAREGSREGGDSPRSPSPPEAMAASPERDVRTCQAAASESSDALFASRVASLAAADPPPAAPQTRHFLSPLSDGHALRAVLRVVRC
jgi:hypothetical protein